MPKYHHWWTLMSTPQRSCESLGDLELKTVVKNCGICSKKEAGEPVSALLIQEEVNRAREVPNGGPSYRQFSPRRGYQQRRHPWKRVLDDSLTKRKKTQWHLVALNGVSNQVWSDIRVTYDGLDMVGPIMLGLSNVLPQWQWIKIIIVEWVHRTLAHMDFGVEISLHGANVYRCHATKKKLFFCNCIYESNQLL